MSSDSQATQMRILRSWWVEALDADQQRGLKVPGSNSVNSKNSKFTFELPVNQTTCKYCRVIGMTLIIILTCAESPMELTVKSDK